jgi:DNA invertase Pin-like site-specific DNA recombinase
MSKIFGYCRVSTGLQTTENQRKEILDYAYSKNLKVDTIIEVTISSRKNSIDRGESNDKRKRYQKWINN